MIWKRENMSIFLITNLDICDCVSCPIVSKLTQNTGLHRGIVSYPMVRHDVMTSWRRNCIPKLTILNYCDPLSGLIVSEFTPYMRDAWEYGFHAKRKSWVRFYAQKYFFGPPRGEFTGIFLSHLSINIVSRKKCHVLLFPSFRQGWKCWHFLHGVRILKGIHNTSSNRMIIFAMHMERCISNYQANLYV